MHIFIISVAALILLGIVIFSVHSGSNNGTISDDKGMIQKIENNTSFPEASKDWGSFKTVAVNSDKLRGSSVNENLTKNISETRISETGGNGIFEEIKLDNSSITAPEPCTEFKTVIANPSKFNELASNGTLNLSLMGDDYELKLKVEETRNPDVVSYLGYIAGKPQSSAFFTVKNDSINGCINVDFFNQTYGIASTDERYNGKIVHVLWRCYSEGGEEEIKKNHSLDPLEFPVKNSDKKKHEISIELFDFFNKSVFKENYSMNPSDEIFSPEIIVEPAYYRYEIILDNKFTFEQRITANYAANVGGSEKLYLTIRDDPDNPIEFCMGIA